MNELSPNRSLNSRELLEPSDRAMTGPAHAVERVHSAGRDRTVQQPGQVSAASRRSSTPAPTHRGARGETGRRRTARRRRSAPRRRARTCPRPRRYTAGNEHVEHGDGGGPGRRAARTVSWNSRVSEPASPADLSGRRAGEVGAGLLGRGAVYAPPAGTVCPARNDEACPELGVVIEARCRCRARPPHRRGRRARR